MGLGSGVWRTEEEEEEVLGSQGFPTECQLQKVPEELQQRSGSPAVLLCGPGGGSGGIEDGRPAVGKALCEGRTPQLVDGFADARGGW